jgi:uncharacterized protein
VDANVGHDSATELGKSISRVLRRYPDVAAGYLFGSAARGEARPGSDLDVGLVYRGARSRERHGRIAPELAAELGKATGFELVDVVDLEAQGPIFCHLVLCDGARVYEGDPDRRVDFESESVIRALDFRPTYEIATRGKVASLRRWLRERHDLRTAAIQARRPEGEPGEAR